MLGYEETLENKLFFFFNILVSCGIKFRADFIFLPLGTVGFHR